MLADHSVVQPDVIYITAARRAIVGLRVEGAPDLVVEILSPGTARRGLGEKLRLYAEAGVAEYWIVDRAVETFEFLVNEGNAFRVRVAEGATYLSAKVHGLALAPDAFWRGIPVL